MNIRSQNDAGLVPFRIADGFSDTIDSMQDRREDADVSSQTIFMSVFLCMLLRLGSLRQLAKDVEAGRIRKFLPRVDKETYCANTVGNGLENIDTHILQQELAVVPKAVVSLTYSPLIPTTPPSRLCYSWIHWVSIW